MDHAVATYGWTDLLPNSFGDASRSRQRRLVATPSGRGAGGEGLRYTLSEPTRREILDRLLELNHQRYAEEVAQGLHDKKKKKGKGKTQKAKSKPTSAADPSGKYTTQGTLFGDDTPTQGKLL